jgi:hypothetical protein
LAIGATRQEHRFDALMEGAAVFLFFARSIRFFSEGSRPGKLGRSMLRPYMNLHWARRIEFEPSILGETPDLGNDRGY